MYLTHLASCKCREAPITILDQLIYLVNQKKSHNTIIRVCACVWSRASGPITQPSHHPATDHKTNITFDVFCPRMVRWPFCRSFWFDILFVEEKNRTKQQAYILLMFHSTMPHLPQHRCFICLLGLSYLPFVIAFLIPECWIFLHAWR